MRRLIPLTIAVMLLGAGTAAAKTVPLGHAITLTSFDAKISVTVHSIKPIPASAYKGNGFAPKPLPYAVTLTIRNLHHAPFTDDLSNDVLLLTASGREGQSDLEEPDSGPCAENVNVESPRLADGHAMTVCVVMDQPPGAHATIVRFTPDAGFANSFGQWHI